MAWKTDPGKWGDAQTIVESLVQPTQQVVQQTERIIQKRQEAKHPQPEQTPATTEPSQPSAPPPAKAAFDILRSKLQKQKHDINTPQPTTLTTAPTPTATNTPAPSQAASMFTPSTRQPMYLQPRQARTSVYPLYQTQKRRDHKRDKQHSHLTQGSQVLA